MDNKQAFNLPGCAFPEQAHGKGTESKGNAVAQLRILLRKPYSNRIHAKTGQVHHILLLQGKSKQKGNTRILNTEGFNKKFKNKGRKPHHSVPDSKEP